MFLIRALFYFFRIFTGFQRPKSKKAIFITLGTCSKAIGEFTVFIHILKKIKWLYPNHYIVAEIYPDYKDLTKCIPFVDYWLEIHDKTPMITLKEIFRFSKYNFEFAFLFYVWQQHYSFALCLDKKNTKFLTKQLFEKKDIYAFFEKFCNYRCLEELQEDIDKNKFLPEFLIPKDSEKNMQKLLAEKSIEINNPILIISPGASNPIRQWPKERFVKVGIELIRKFPLMQLVITGSRAEKDLTQKIASMIGAGAVDLGGCLKLDEFIAFVKRATLLIGNDSGPAHIARAVGTSCITIYGPTEPAIIPETAATFMPLTHANTLRCYPCYYDCSRSGFECLKLIEPNEVVEVAINFLAKNENRKYQN